MRAVELLRNKFGVSQLYKHEIKSGDEILLEIYWHPLTIAERESIQKKSSGDDAGDFALSLMLEKALDKDGKRLFQDGDRAALRREVEASILQEIQLAMLTSGAETKVEEAKATLKS
jgi:hypothetical protein